MLDPSRPGGGPGASGRVETFAGDSRQGDGGLASGRRGLLPCARGDPGISDRRAMGRWGRGYGHHLEGLMRFPPEVVDRVRESADIVAVVSEHVRLKKTGRSLKGLCPFHQEKTPSFHVN